MSNKDRIAQVAADTGWELLAENLPHWSAVYSRGEAFVSVRFDSLGRISDHSLESPLLYNSTSHLTNRVAHIVEFMAGAGYKEKVA